MKTNQSHSSFLGPQGDSEAIDRFIALTAKMRSEPTNVLWPDRKTHALLEALNILPLLCDIKDLGVRPINEEITNHLLSPNEHLAPKITLTDVSGTMRITPLYLSKKDEYDPLASHESKDKTKKTDRLTRRNIYLCEEVRLIEIEVTYDNVGNNIQLPSSIYVSPCYSTDIIWYMQKHPFFLMICLEQIIALARDSNERSRRRMLSMDKAANMMNMTLVTLLQKDIDTFILASAREQKTCSVQEDILEENFRKLLRLAGKSPKERKEQLELAMERIRHIDFQTLQKISGLSHEKTKAIMKEENP